MQILIRRFAAVTNVDSRAYDDVAADRTASIRTIAVSSLAACAAGLSVLGWWFDAEFLLASSAVTASLALLARLGDLR